MSRRIATSQQLLDWVLQRGNHSLAVGIRRAGRGYQVLVSAPDQKRRLFAERCKEGPNALRLHAELVSGFRAAGWRSVAYR